MNYKILSLHLYPIKSCAGFSVTEALMTNSGFQWDRNWVIVDSQGEFMSQRKHRKMAMIKTALKTTGDGLFLEVTVPEYEIPFLISTRDDGVSTTTVSVWGDQVSGKLENSDVNEALSDFLGENVRLVRFNSSSERTAEIPEKKIVAEITFKDSMPVLVTNLQSLKDLEAKVGSEIPMSRFRPNIVIEGARAYEEDDWTHLQIGAVKLKSAIPSARCVVITIDQVTGEAKGPEPLKTLTKDRRFGKRVNFGQFFVPVETGIIRAGDVGEIS